MTMCIAAVLGAAALGTLFGLFISAGLSGFVALFFYRIGIILSITALVSGYLMYDILQRSWTPQLRFRIGEETHRFRLPGTTHEAVFDFSKQINPARRRRRRPRSLSCTLTLAHGSC